MNYDIEAVILGAGGVAELSNMLGMKQPQGFFAVSQWRRRGAIPAKHILAHHALFKALEHRGRKRAMRS